MISVSHLIEHQFEQRKGGVENFVRLLTQQRPDSQFRHQIISKTEVGDRYSLGTTLNGARDCEISNPELGRALSSSDHTQSLNTNLVHIHQIMPYGLRPIIKLQSVKPSILTLHDYFPFCHKVHFYPNKGGLCKQGPSVTKCSTCIGSKWSFLPLMAFFGYRMQLVQQFFEKLEAIIIPNEDLFFEIPEPLRIKTSIIPYAVPLSSKVNSTSKEGYIYVGAMAPHKGIFQLLEDLERLGFDGRFDLYGPKPSQGMPRLPFFANYNGLLEDRTIMQSYKALVLPSVWKETGPLVVLEALEEGVPVLARRGSISSTYSNSSFVQFFSSAEELMSLSIPNSVERPNHLPDLEKVITLHHDLYTKVWESSQVRYNRTG